MPDDPITPPAAPAPAPTAPAPAPAVPTAATVPIAPPAAPPAAAPATPPAAPAASPAPTTPAAPAAADDPTAKLLERIKALETSSHNNLRDRIMAENGIAREAAEFLTATDEAGLIAQAQKLKGFAPAAAGQQQTPSPPPAGSNTNPPAVSTPTLDERIADAEKNGNRFESMRLKLEKISG